MPFARLTLNSELELEEIQALAITLTDLLANDLGKRRDLTSVLIEAPQNARWCTAALANPTSAHLDVCVTAGTNTAAQKQAFIANAMQALRAAIPSLPSATYIVVQELPAQSWGYDGRTQAERSSQSVSN